MLQHLSVKKNCSKAAVEAGKRAKSSILNGTPQLSFAASGLMFGEVDKIKLGMTLFPS